MKAGCLSSKAYFFDEKKIIFGTMFAWEQRLLVGRMTLEAKFKVCSKRIIRGKVQGMFKVSKMFILCGI